MSRRIVIAFVTVAMISAGLYVGVLVIGGRTHTIEKVLSRYQFTELNPPSTLSPPGTLVTVMSDNPLVIDVTCTSSEALGNSVQAMLLVSDSTSSKEAEELTGSFDLSGDGRTHLTGEIGSQFVKKVEVTLTNVKLLEIPDTAVFEFVSKRNDNCKKAVAYRRKMGQQISMIKSVIQANALYRLEFERDVDTAARAKISRQIAAGMGLRINGGSGDTIEGDGLFWGVRDDEALAEVSPDQPPPTGAAVRHQLLPIGRFALVTNDVQKPH